MGNCSERSADSGAVGFELVHLGDGTRLTRRQVEGMAAAFACVDVISTAVAALPPVIEMVGPGGAVAVVEDHPLAGMLRRPNAWQSWPDFRSMVRRRECLWEGNALAVLEPGGMVEPVRWTGVQPISRRGRPAFWAQKEVWPGDLAGNTARRRLYGGERVIHVKDRSDDGRIGVSRRARATGSLELAYRTMRGSQAAYRNALMPSGSADLSTAADGGTEGGGAGAGAGAIRRGRKRGDGDDHGRRVGLDADHHDAARRGAAGGEAAECAGGLPGVRGAPAVGPGLHVQHFHQFSTQAGVWFAQFTLAGWVTKIEAELTEKLLGDGYRLRLDMSALLRGDVTERWAAYDKALEHGVLTAERVAAMEGWL